MGCWGLVERRKGVGCGATGREKAPEGRPGLRSDDETTARCQPPGETIQIGAVVQWRAMVS